MTLASERLKQGHENRRRYYREVGKRVKLSALGLLARGLRERGFDENTRGTIHRSDFAGTRPDEILAVLVDGRVAKEHWGSEFWEVIDKEPAPKPEPSDPISIRKAQREAWWKDHHGG